ncbi:MAG: dipeptidase [Ornithinimicrobium sp.]|uniref:dipeptidase n=1 Tax=Ornithinimicrobium sp. TaxID=1977084 RepID=UPI003D9AC76B
MTSDQLPRVETLLREHPLVDGHNDLAWAARKHAAYDWDVLDITRSTAGTTHTDLPRLRQGCVGAQFWSVFVPSTLPPDQAVIQTLEQVDAVHTMVGRYADRLGLATSAEQVRQVFASGRVASLMGAEGGHSIGCSLGVLRMLHRLGGRYLTLTHNDNTPWADSATDEPVLGGLSEFGREVVRQMNRLGMLVDLSHVSADTMRDALATSSAPVIFSHSGAQAVCDSPRNVPDDVLVTMAQAGGTCMAVFAPQFVSQEVRDWREEAAASAAQEGIAATDLERFEPWMAGHRQQHREPQATLAQVVEHLEHLREVAGVEHIGIGGDYDGVSTLPMGLEDVSRYPHLFAALAERGWSDADLVAVAGGNVLRTLADAEDVARGPAG